MIAKTGAEFEYPAPSKKSGVIVHACKLSTGKSELGEPRGHLANQWKEQSPGSLSQKQGGEVLKKTPNVHL